MVKLRMRLDVVVRNARGKVTFRGHKTVRSYVLAMDDLLYVQMANQTQVIPDIGNTPRSISADAQALRCTAGVGVTTSGTRLGTGTNAVAITDYALQTAIAQGSGAGQLMHSNESYTAPVTVGSSRQFTLARVFTNKSGGNITVHEVGLYGLGGPGNSFCLERTLYDFTINNGSSATVTYTIGVTV